MVPVTKGALVHAVVYLALAALIMDTRRGELDAPNILAKVAELEGRLAELDGCERRPRGKGWRRRVQAAPASCTDTNTFQARTDAAMDACCPAAPGGARRRPPSLPAGRLQPARRLPGIVCGDVHRLL